MWLSEAPPPVLLQVNIGDEPQKHGIAAGRVAELAEAATSAGLVVKGLMAIPPLSPDPEQTRPHFAALAKVRDALSADFPSMTELSMGMSDDYEVAIEEGSTIIRVGRAIFEPAGV